MDTPQVKGIFLAHVRDYVVKTHGEQALSELVASLGEKTGAMVSSPFAFEWYPLTACIEIERAFCDKFHGGDPEQAYRLGQHDLEMSISTVYRFLFRVLSISTVIAKAGKLWSNYYDRGSIRVEQPDPQQAIITVQDVDLLDYVHCCELRGAFVGLINLCKLPVGTAEHIECRNRGGTACVYRVKW